jgi:aspartate/tyrosine/aromatic aminotransferase
MHDMRHRDAVPSNMGLYGERVGAISVVSYG